MILTDMTITSSGVGAVLAGSTCSTMNLGSNLIRTRFGLRLLWLPSLRKMDLRFARTGRVHSVESVPVMPAGVSDHVSSDRSALTHRCAGADSCASCRSHGFVQYLTMSTTEHSPGGRTHTCLSPMPPLAAWDAASPLRCIKSSPDGKQVKIREAR